MIIDFRRALWAAAPTAIALLGCHEPAARRAAEQAAVRLSTVTAHVEPIELLFDPIFQGLAISLMAGEIASPLLSRMTVPVVYTMMRRRERRRRASQSEEAPPPLADEALTRT